MLFLHYLQFIRPHSSHCHFHNVTILTSVALCIFLHIYINIMVPYILSLLSHMLVEVSKQENGHLNSLNVSAQDVDVSLC